MTETLTEIATPGRKSKLQFPTALRDAIAQSGSFALTIGPIPLVMKQEKTLTFTAADVDALRRRMEDAANG